VIGPPVTTDARIAAAPALKQLFAGAFRVGAAINPHQFTGRDTVGAALIARHFDTVTPENVLKWECVHPAPGRYTFAQGDQYVDFGTRHRMFVVGHTLVWHNQTPAWVFEDSAGQPVGRDTLLARMREHIQTVVGRYKGRIRGWDVVNEALNEDGTLRDSPWRRIIGDDYLVHAFRFAAEADPQAELYYNDYSLENAPKREGAVRIVRMLQAAGAPITGIGTQQHVHMGWPTVAQVDTTLAAFGALGVKVMVTELDVDVLPRPTRSQGAEVTDRVDSAAALDPYRAGLPDSVQRALAERYGALFAVYRKHRGTLTRVTFWGRARRRLVAQRLAGARAHELPAALRPRGASEAGVRRGGARGARDSGATGSGAQAGERSLRKARTTRPGHRRIAPARRARAIEVCRPNLAGGPDADHRATHEAGRVQPTGQGRAGRSPRARDLGAHPRRRVPHRGPPAADP
jgi:endo-1,4-beta-xylanase